MSNVADCVLDYIKPIVTDLGYDIVDVEYKRQQNGMNLTVFIDSPNGIKIDDCEKVHNAIDGPLDTLDPTNGSSYILNVSSPGLDRPLKTNSDLDRNIGQMVTINLYSKFDGKKEYDGILKKYNDESILLEVNKVSKVFERKNISKITKFITF